MRRMCDIPRGLIFIFPFSFFAANVDNCVLHTWTSPEQDVGSHERLAVYELLRSCAMKPAVPAICATHLSEQVYENSGHKQWRGVRHVTAGNRAVGVKLKSPPRGCSFYLFFLRNENQQLQENASQKPSRNISPCLYVVKYTTVWFLRQSCIQDGLR